MHIDKAKSIFNSLTVNCNTIAVSNKRHQGFPQGINKASEYSWFYLLSLQGQTGEIVTVNANVPTHSPTRLTRSNSLVFMSLDQGSTWEKINHPVWTNHEGITQKYTIQLPTNQQVLLSNTILFNYQKLQSQINNFVHEHQDICHKQTIGTSLLNNDLDIITFNQANSPNRILVTTGCHPAEPDIIGSFAILDYLASDQASSLRSQYTIDVMPIQNPDGYATKNCLTNNGINLYWNFRKDDEANCPEAYYLWQYIQHHPPMLYLDFHAYVHQYHRQPMPYIKPTQLYIGKRAKQVVRQMDRLLTRQSRGYYRFGKLTTWPEALSHHITKEFNTIAYTKYHFNLYEGIPASRQRALSVFQGLTNILLKNNVTANHVLTSPHGQATPDSSDTSRAINYYRTTQALKNAYVYTKSYTRYYRHRNKNNLYKKTPPK